MGRGQKNADSKGLAPGDHGEGQAQEDASSGIEPGFDLGSNFSFLFGRVQTWVQLGFELLEEFELFQGSKNSILNLGSTWVLIGFHSTWV